MKCWVSWRQPNLQVLKAANLLRKMGKWKQAGLIFTKGNIQ